MIRVNGTTDFIEVVSLNFEDKNNGPQLQVMRRVIRLVSLQLPRGVSDDVPSLHQHCAQTQDRRVTIHHEILDALW